MITHILESGKMYGIENYDPKKLIMLKDIVGMWVPIYDGVVFSSQMCGYLADTFAVFYKNIVKPSLGFYACETVWSAYKEWRNVAGFGPPAKDERIFQNSPDISYPPEKQYEGYRGYLRRL